MDGDAKAKAQERVAMARVALDEAIKVYDAADAELDRCQRELDAALTALDYPPKNPNI